jgi:hypothetical protein
MRRKKVDKSVWVKCSGVKRGCDDMSCKHRRKHRPFQHPDADDGIACTGWINCDASPGWVKVRCMPVKDPNRRS